MQVSTNNVKKSRQAGRETKFGLLGKKLKLKTAEMTLLESYLFYTVCQIGKQN